MKENKQFQLWKTPTRRPQPHNPNGVGNHSIKVMHHNAKVPRQHQFDPNNPPPAVRLSFDDHNLDNNQMQDHGIATPLVLN